MTDDRSTAVAPSSSRSRRWGVWAIVVALVGVPAVAGGLLIGLPLGLAGALAGAVLLGAAALVTWRRRADALDEELRLGAVLPFVAISAIVTLGLIQLVPYGRAHDNPAADGEPAWSSPRTRELMVNACFGCHSNEVEWPWYSNIAPVSWAITDHVDEGREAVNYSNFATDRGDADETIEEIEKGSMPPGYYTAFGLHSEANLSDAEIDELLAGLRATPGLDDGDFGTERDDDSRSDDSRSDDNGSDDGSDD